MSAGGPARGLRYLAAKPEVLVLVCRKCSRKLGGGFGRDGSERLAKMLRRHHAVAGQKAGQPRRSTVAIVETGCLDVCPKGAVVVLRGDRPGDWLLVARGTPVTDVSAALGLPGGIIMEA